MVKKKLVSLALCGVMCLSMAVPALAAELPEEMSEIAVEATEEVEEEATEEVEEAIGVVEDTTETVVVEDATEVVEDATATEATQTTSEDVLQTDSENVDETQHFFDWNGTTLTEYTGVGGDVTIPSGCTVIDDYAFAGSKVTSITIPDSVTTICYDAFGNCRNLKTVRFGNGITVINAYAFENCSALEHVYMPYNSTIGLGFASKTGANNCTYHVYDGSEAHKQAIQKGYTYEIIDKFIPNAVNDLKAVSVGRKQNQLTWSKSAKADGYIIYAVKNKKYGYCGMTSATTFTDTSAVDDDYTFYYVFPFAKDGTKKNVGKCPNYVFAKAVCPRVTNLKASPAKGAVKLSWTRSAGATGYLIYGMTASGKYHYIGMTTTNTVGFTDTKASKTEYNFYWVFPYHTAASGKMIVGQICQKYVYGKAR